MSSLLLALSIVPLFSVNIWHSLLLARRNKDGKPHTISEHAVETPITLRTHRFVHTIGAVILIVFAAGYLFPEGHLLAGWLIVLAAVFDCLQALTLNKRSAQPRVSSHHFITAWTMALCYLLYASDIVLVAGLGYWLVAAIWLLLALLFAAAAVRRFKNFWIVQHLYFWFIALIIATAHTCLLI